jgi:hypothetical protein
MMREIYEHYLLENVVDIPKKPEVITFLILIVTISSYHRVIPIIPSRLISSHLTSPHLTSYHGDNGDYDNETG